ncbi:hypothetical protein BH23ACT6_BH23ACT6_18400 [soil metagenome]
MDPQAPSSRRPNRVLGTRATLAGSWIVVAGLLAIGAYNHFRVAPSLAVPARHETPSGSASELLRRSATHETGIMLVIVLLTAGLVAAAVTP